MSFSMSLPSRKRRRAGAHSGAAPFGAGGDELQGEAGGGGPHSSEDDQTTAEAKRLVASGAELAGDGEFQDAHARFARALAACSGLAEAWEMRSQCEMELGLAFEAVKSAERAVALRPAWAEALVTLGRAQRNFGEIELASETLAEAARRERDAGARASIEAEAQEAAAVAAGMAMRSGASSIGRCAVVEGGGEDGGAPRA